MALSHKDTKRFKLAAAHIRKHLQKERCPILSSLADSSREKFIDDVRTSHSSPRLKHAFYECKNACSMTGAMPSEKKCKGGVGQRVLQNALAPCISTLSWRSESEQRKKAAPNKDLLR